jgi:hypothetical protein
MPRQLRRPGLGKVFFNGGAHSFQTRIPAPALSEAHHYPGGIMAGVAVIGQPQAADRTHRQFFGHGNLLGLVKEILNNANNECKKNLHLQIALRSLTKYHGILGHYLLAEKLHETERSRP